MIKIYTKNYCPYCKMAKDLLSSLGAKFDETDITFAPEIIEDLVKKSGMYTVPQVYVGENCLGGYTDLLALHKSGELEEKLKL